MQFSVRVTDYQKNIMLNMCDAELIGKEVTCYEFIINYLAKRNIILKIKKN